MNRHPTRESLLATVRDGAADAASCKRTDFWNPTLNIRYVDGRSVAFLYSHLIWMNFDPAVGIILHFSTHTVKVQGRNLARLYAELLELKRRHLVVVDESHDLGEPDAVVVHRVGVVQESSDSRDGRGP